MGRRVVRGGIANAHADAQPLPGLEICGTAPPKAAAARGGFGCGALSVGITDRLFIQPPYLRRIGRSCRNDPRPDHPPFRGRIRRHSGGCVGDGRPGSGDAVMPFDPFRKREPRFKPHVADVMHTACVQCGLSIWAWYQTSCDPDSEDARSYRRRLQDGMVGRITGNSTVKR